VTVRRGDWILLAAILLLAALALWIDVTSPGLAFWRPVPEGATPEQVAAVRATTLRLGLDLRGGMQVILEGQGDADRVNRDTMEVASSIIADRVNALGVAEAVVQVQGENRLVVELPGVTDPAQALAAMQNTGFLEFVDTRGEFFGPDTAISTSYGLSDEQIAAITWTAVYQTVVTGDELAPAAIGVDANDVTGRPEVTLGFNAEGTRKFAAWTSENVGQPLAIVLDKRVVSAPTVTEPIPSGQAAINGENIDQAEALRIALLLKYGALPVAMAVVENRTVGPTLGQDSVNKSVVAGVIGLGMVLLFMALYYRLPGVLAGLALCLYTLVIFAIYKLVPVTLTLPGIAGLLLSIGMAVDANVLIFERMKEELRAGKVLRAAIEAGFDRAWTSIWDSNLSTLLTCVVLFLFGRSLGASIVKGFAITLAIGVAVSMFSAITVTRTLLRAVYAAAGALLERRSRLLLGVEAGKELL
jgi:preprotein translocase subunit SecD